MGETITAGLVCHSCGPISVVPGSLNREHDVIFGDVVETVYPISGELVAAMNQHFFDTDGCNGPFTITGMD